jgi:hypothetical protein
MNMAISKEQAYNQARERVAGEVDSWERKIDAWLISRTYDTEVYTADNIPPLVRDVLIKRYRAAGWDCSCDINGDGVFLKFR